jgi:hypothetical protein
MMLLNCVVLHLRLVLLGLPDCSAVISLMPRMTDAGKRVSPARRKGRANPVPVCISRGLSIHWRVLELTHETPELERKALL